MNDINDKTKVKLIKYWKSYLKSLITVPKKPSLISSTIWTTGMYKITSWTFKGNQLTKNNAPDKGKSIYVAGCHTLSKKLNNSVRQPINIPKAIANHISKNQANNTFDKLSGTDIWLKR